MKKINSVGIFLFLFVLSACSSLPMITETDCRKVSWEKFGYDIASSGRRIDEYNETEKRLVNTCRANYNVEIERAELYQGYTRGQKFYCSRQNGYKMGANGELVAPICSRSDFPAYHEGYRRGLNGLCTYHGGYDFAMSDTEYLETCPKGKEKQFLKGLRKGRTDRLNTQQTKLEETVENEIADEDFEENDVQNMNQ